MGNIPTITEIDTAIRAAIDALSGGWDWPQDFADGEGERHVIDGPAYIDDLPDEQSRESAREYDEFVRSSYTWAQEYAEEARRRLADDLSDALNHIREASRLEAETGDDAAMAEPLRMVRDLEESL